MKKRRSNLVLMLIVSSICACSPAPQPVAPTATREPAHPPTRQPAGEPPLVRTCPGPSIAGALDLVSLPGVVREPMALARLGQRIYVAGYTSDTIGLVENDQLVGTLPAGRQPSALFADESLGRLFVLNAGDLTVSMLDGQTLLATLPISRTGAEYQYATAMTGDAQEHRLFVALNSEHPEVVVVDAQSFTVSARWSIDTGGTINRLAIDAPGNRLLVSDGSAVSAYDLQSQQRIERVAVPGSTYRILLPDAASGRVYVDTYADGSKIAAIEDGRQTTLLPVGADPYAGLIVNDRLYVTNNFSNTVSVIDLRTDRPLAAIDAGPGPTALIADTSGERIYVAVRGAFGKEANRLDVIDTRRNAVVGLIPLDAQVRQFIGDEARGRLYALMPSWNAVMVSDGQQTLAQIPLQRAPSQMALDAATGKLYVTDTASGELSIVDVNTNQVVNRKDLELSVRPDAVAVDRANGRLLVNNRAYSLDALQPTGHYSLTGYTLPYGEGEIPLALMVNPSVPRVYAAASNGVAGSNGGVILYAIDVSTLTQTASNGDRNITAWALDDAAQRLYTTTSHPMAGTAQLNVLDALGLNRIALLALRANVTALALNPITHHLFLTYFGHQPGNADNTLEVLDTRTLGRVASFQMDASPNAIGVLGDSIFIASNASTHLTLVRDCEAEAPPAPTPTPSPTPYPTLTPLPTSTPAPVTRNTPVNTATPTPCAIAVADWIPTGLQASLGCPIEAPRRVTLGEQSFQNGFMLWREDTRQVFVVEANGPWSMYADTWDGSQPEGGSYAPPSGLVEPKRGFGKVWREQLGGPKARIGWATAEEIGTVGEAQTFEGGSVAFRTTIEGARILFADGTWR